MTVLMASYNIQYGLGRDGRYDLARAISAVRAADILALQEVERHWPRTGMSDQAAEIAALMPEHYWVYGPPFDIDASTRDHAGRAVNLRRQFGPMLLSRWPILSMRVHQLPKHDTGAVYNMATGALEAVIGAPGGALRIYNFHLAAVYPEERLDQIARLQAVVHAAPAEGGVWNGGAADEDSSHWESGAEPPPMPKPAILMGDFNATPETAEYAAITAGTGRLVDCWRALGNPEAGAVTFYADPKQDTYEDIRIDYCFVTRDLAPRIRRSWIDLDTRASDHQPVWTEIDI